MLPRVLSLLVSCALTATGCDVQVPDGESAQATGAASKPAGTDAACDVSKADREWINSSVAAWHRTALSIREIGAVEEFRAVFFDAGCVLTSDTAMAGTSAAGSAWTATPHGGTVRLPDGDEMPAVVTSFTQANDGPAHFVMSTPSVWRDGGVDGGVLGLDKLMTAVLLHEGSHVVQASTYGVRITELSNRYNLPDSFNDDSVQERFGDDQAFADAIAREIALLFEAAEAADKHAVRRLAQEARALMRERHSRWFTDDDAWFQEAEDLWLTLEGSGQWIGYTWLTDANGGAVGREDTMSGFGRRSSRWTQNEGLALFLVLDRLDPGWKRHAFGDAALTAIEMLDLAIANGHL